MSQSSLRYGLAMEAAWSRVIKERDEAREVCNDWKVKARTLAAERDRLVEELTRFRRGDGA